jgi:two-component system, NtrC family, response regulator AtoC
MLEKTGKILIVDDEEDTAMLVSDSLRRRGYDSQHVTSAASCLEWLALEPVDVVVTDIQMPGMSGLELCERLRTGYPNCASIVLTGYGTRDLAVAASRAGARELLTKPAKIDALDHAIARALEHVRTPT